MLSLDSMFGLEQGSQRTEIVRIPLIKLKPFDNQPFKLYSDKKLQELATDIKQNGLLSPITVRPVDGGMYQILAGHNRVNAFLLNQENAIDAIVRQVDDAEAELILVQSNLVQRQELSNAEKAKAYQMRHKALKAIGKKKRGNHNSLSALAEETNESQRTVARYIKAANLIPDLMTRFDNNEFPVSVAEMLSTLSPSEQVIVDEFLETSGSKINGRTAASIMKLAENGKLSRDNINTLEVNVKLTKTVDDIRSIMLESLGEQFDEITFAKTLEILKKEKIIKKI
ncbi:ParB/RepB/Spo0J family partition protein [Aerococcaceae bacterium NML191292]|nr:ParB/RepB/Spo0J family partition protein [Aerococcaceae bacterium NML191292]